MMQDYSATMPTLAIQTKRRRRNDKLAPILTWAATGRRLDGKGSTSSIKIDAAP
jgi:hypothetical protein